MPVPALVLALSRPMRLWVLWVRLLALFFRPRSVRLVACRVCFCPVRLSPHRRPFRERCGGAWLFLSGSAVGATSPGGWLRASRLCLRMWHLAPGERGAWYTGCGGVVHSSLKSGRKLVARSEERRVGEECRSRWSAYHSKKKDVRDGV